MKQTKLNLLIQKDIIWCQAKYDKLSQIDSVLDDLHTKINGGELGVSVCWDTDKKDGDGDFVETSIGIEINNIRNHVHDSMRICQQEINQLMPIAGYVYPRN